MKKTESKTLREFSLVVVNNRGNTFTIKYGYDLSTKHPCHYVKASINGSNFSSNKKTLSRVRALGITAINELIEAVDTNVSGAPEDYESVTSIIVNSYVEGNIGFDEVKECYRITTVDEEEALGDFLDSYSEASTRSQKSLLRKYNNSRRETFLERSKSLIKGLRNLYLKGVRINDEQYVPKFEGILKNTYYPFYYKRDVDYIRKARVNIFTNVLKRKYKPFK